jgi:hypothetical protein
MDEEDEGNRAHGRRKSEYKLEDNIKVHVKQNVRLWGGFIRPTRMGLSK